MPHRCCPHFPPALRTFPIPLVLGAFLSLAPAACAHDPAPAAAAPVPCNPSPPPAPSATAAPAAATPPRSDLPASSDLVSALVQKFGEAERPRITRGVAQVVSLWRPQDGDAAALRDLLSREYLADVDGRRDATFARFETAFEQVDGHLHEIGRELRRWNELEIGAQLPIDARFGSFEAGAHLAEDYFSSKLAFIALLNFRRATLDETVAEGAKWSRREWAEARLGRRFALRPSATARQARAKASAEAEEYIAGYNLWMHHVLGPGGQRVFPKGVRLITHWNLRDEIKAGYAEAPAVGLARQRVIRTAMERIVTQTIPKTVIDDPRLDWDPVANAVALAPPAEVEEAKQGSRPAQAVASTDREPDTRYAMLLGTHHAARLVDPDSPIAPTEVDRRFQLETEIPEKRVVQLLESVLASPVVPRIAKVIEQRLGRPLEPHDIWYAGFLARSKYPEAKLSEITRKKYPNAAAFKKDIPRILQVLGFTPDKARFLDDHIVVDPARGAGHALEAMRRGDVPHLRTRINPDGMDFKGYNIAVHELGHNVEQVFSLYEVDHTLLAGVPGNAFTEALAFTFQNRDLEVLGLAKPDAASERLRVLNDAWATWEISGVALTDLAVWRWMYAHPNATPAELREATIGIARGLWDKWYAPIVGGKGSPLLAIYSHMISSFLYLPDYPIGHMIAFQLEEKLKGPKSGAEFERAASFGRVLPDLWMEHATGKPVTSEPLLKAAEGAVAGMGGGN